MKAKAIANRKHKPIVPPPTPIRQQYEQHSVRGFYEQFGAEYRNPHESAIVALVTSAVERWQLNCDRVLDLACGSGEVTLALRGSGYANITGIDPYTYAAYQHRTGLEAETYSFEDIAAGMLSDRYYSLIVCSFALHLIPSSWLPLVVYQLRQIAHSLVVITPNKSPQLKPEWGWTFLDEIESDRVRARLYQ
ncbi:class I SAM-dependent methyltransferase [Pseudanabaena sp. PCC 6802]|uniref:class I SAM-dependent methyltransferase n=1 Tax=Pseudanabaena sp. PCC 6802 TaxID=118173 RepID=UPI000349078A|nr:class I SAM-dependent methyltransferase [Pseudanabaena sp. PCC 6802]